MRILANCGFLQVFLLFLFFSTFPLKGSGGAEVVEERSLGQGELDHSTWEELMRAASLTAKLTKVKVNKDHQGHQGQGQQKPSVTIPIPFELAKNEDKMSERIDLTAGDEELDDDVEVLLEPEELALKSKSQQFVTSYQTLKIAYFQLKKKLKDTEETCHAQAEFLKDWNSYVANQQHGGSFKDGEVVDFEREVIERLKKLLQVELQNSLAIGSLDKMADLNRTLLDNQLSIEAEISKLSSLVRRNDDLALERLERLLTDLRTLSREGRNERVFFEETFSDEVWKKKWDPFMPGHDKEKNYERISQGPPYFINMALRSKESMAYHQGIVARFPEFSTKRVSLVLQYTLKYTIGDMFFRLHDCNTQWGAITNWDTYILFIGNRNSKDNGHNNQLILRLKDPATGGRYEQDKLINTIRGPTDRYTHVYTLELEPDNNFRILVDDVMVFSDILKVPFFGFPQVCGLSFFNQFNPLSMELDNLLLTSDLNYAKQRRLEILQFMAIEKEFEFEGTLLQSSKDSSDSKELKG